MLSATVMLLLQGLANTGNKKPVLIGATVLGVLAHLDLSQSMALLVTLPVVLLILAHGINNLFKDKQLKPVLISLALMLFVSSLPAEIISYLPTAMPNLKQLNNCI